MTRTILHTRFILITSSTAGFMALSGGGERAAERAGLALGAAPRPPRAAPRSRRRRMPGRPRPAPGGVNAALGVTTPRARRRGALRARGEAGQAGSRGGARRAPPSPRAQMVPPGGGGGGRRRAGRPRGAVGPRPGPSRPRVRPAAAGRAAALPVNLSISGALSSSSGARGPAAAGGQEHPPLPGSAPRSVCGEKFSSPTLRSACRFANPKCLPAGLPSLRRLLQPVPAVVFGRCRAAPAGSCSFCQRCKHQLQAHGAIPGANRGTWPDRNGRGCFSLQTRDF